MDPAKMVRELAIALGIEIPEDLRDRDTQDQWMYLMGYTSSVAAAERQSRLRKATTYPAAPIGQPGGPPQVYGYPPPPLITFEPDITEQPGPTYER